MKRIWTVGLFILFVLLLENNAVLGSRLHQEDGIYPNHSADYVRTLNRNASTDADAAFYNPAGLAFMKKKGLHVMLSSQTYYKKRLHSMDYYNINIPSMAIDQATFNTGAGFVTTRPTGGVNGDNSYFAEITAPVLPDLDIVYRSDLGGRPWAAYFDLSVTQAAPGIVFPKGLAVVDFGNLATPEAYAAMGGVDLTSYNRTSVATRTEYYISGTVGGSYAFFDWLSTALGVRYINIRGNQSITVRDVQITSTDAGFQSTIDSTLISDWDVDVDYTGHEFGLICGMDFKPLDSLIIALRYEYYFDTNAKKKTKKFLVPSTVEQTGELNLLKDGTPGGVGGKMPYSSGNGSSTFKVTYPQSISVGISYQVLRTLRLDTGVDIYLRPFVDLDGREKDFNIGYRIGASVEWAFLEDVRVSAGYSFNNPGIKESKRNEVDPLLLSHSIGGGFAFDVNKELTISVGGFYVFYMPETVTEVMNTNISGDMYHTMTKELAEKSFSVAIGATYCFSSL